MSHARLGFHARWYCRDCTTVQHAGRYACRCCCGYTTSRDKVTRGVLTMKGKPMAGCLR
jgi:hypothetical protein